MSIRSALKNVLIPSEVNFRRFPFGISSGIVMRVDFRHQTRIFLGLYEIEIAGHCKRLLRRSRCAFDIGANAGYYSLILGKHTGGKVIAVEPMDAGISEMHANFEHNPYPITAVQALVGASPGDGMVSIDQLAEAHFTPDFIKMDIEGGELAALEGARHILETHRPHMVIEVHSKDLENGCRELLTPYGYTITRVDPRGWLPEERVDGYNGWIICEGSPNHTT
jgi:hypothetical protein